MPIPKRHERTVKRLSLLLVFLVIADCGPLGSRKVPLRFTKTWVAGEAEVDRARANAVPVTIRIRLGDRAAFAKEFNLREPFALPCQQIRLLYRHTPQSAPQFLQPKWSHAGALWSDAPQLCFQASVEWTWHLLIAGERGDLPLDVDGRLVLISGEKESSQAEVAVVVLRIPWSSEDFNQQFSEGFDAFTLARSQWLPLGR